MSAEKFIDHVATTGSVDDAILEKLRRKIAKSDKPVSIEAIVKVLMDQGHLTRFLATKLVTDYSQSLKSEGKSEGKSEAKTDPSLRAPKTSSQSAAEDDLGFAPDDSLDGRTSLGDIKKQAAPTPEEDDIVELEDASESGSKRQVAPSDPASTGWQETDPVSSSVDPLAGASSPADPLADLPAGDPLAGDFGEYQEPAHQPVATPSSGGLQLPEPTRSQWDTKLIIGGSLALGILAIAAFGLFFVLRSGSASEVFEAAEKDYNTGAYQNAIDKYQLFLKKYPKHDNASLAWVRQKMAGLRQNISRPSEALTYALKELPELKVQPAFGEARGELASLLPTIAENFADQAAKARETEKKGELIANAEKSMDELVNQAAYIPSKMHKNPDVASRIKRIKEKIKNVRRNIDRENNLVAAVKKINEFTNKGETSDAFVARRTLLENYPGLEDDGRLVKAVINISKKEAELVVVMSETKKPVTGEEAGSLQDKNLPKRSNISKDIPGVAGHVCCVLAGGAVHGIDVTTGNSRWRRFVGAETTVHPQPVSSEPGADVLLVDSKNHDLMRVKSQTGELVWRLPIGKPFLTPVHYKDLLLINTRDGWLLEVNLKTGANTRIVEFPMELGTAATYGDEQPLLYQVGEHNNLYVVDIETMECKEVLYVGHKKGSMQVPPVYAVGFLVLIENIASDRSILHVIAMNEKGEGLNEIQRIALRGKVVVPPLVFERRVLVATDLGAVHVYDVDPNIDPPIQTLADVNASATKSFVSYPIVYRGQVWVAGKTLAKYRVQPALSQLNRVWIHDDGDTFMAPLQRVEDVLIHMRRQQGKDEITVSGQPTESEEPSWETDLGAPAKVSLDRKNNRLRVVSAQGGYSLITPENSKQTVLEHSSQAPQEAQKLAFNRLVEFSGGRLTVTGSGQQNQGLVIESAAEPVRPRLVALQPFGTKAADAIGFQDRLLVPFKEGMIRLFDLQDGSQSVLPFQPGLRAGDQKAWSAPVVDRASPDKFVVLENGRHLYRVGIKESPQRHLTAFQQRMLAEPIGASIAALGDTLFAVKREADHDVVVTFQLPGFEDDHQWALKGRVTWGPRRVNDRVFVATDQQGLFCFDSQWNWWQTAAVLRWQTALPYGHLAGLPFKQKNSYVLASTNGTVWRIDRQTGQELEKIEPIRLQEPLWGNPVVHDGQLWLSGIDGVLFVIPFPPAT